MQIKCDRCGEYVEGFIDDTSSGGVYVCSSGYWKKYARPGEDIICDECMWSDPRYIKSHGVVGGTTVSRATSLCAVSKSSKRRT